MSPRQARITCAASSGSGTPEAGVPLTGVLHCSRLICLPPYHSRLTTPPRGPSATLQPDNVAEDSGAIRDRLRFRSPWRRRRARHPRGAIHLHPRQRRPRRRVSWHDSALLAGSTRHTRASAIGHRYPDHLLRRGHHLCDRGRHVVLAAAVRARRSVRVVAVGSAVRNVPRH